MSYYLGIDIGGTTIKYAIGNPGEKPADSGLLPTPKSSLLDFLAAMRALISSLIRDYPIRGIGIATPGTIDRRSGKLRGVNPNLPWWTDVSPLLIVPDEYRNIAFCDNDANLMTLAEAPGTQAFVLGVTIGTGIGSGFVTNSAVYHGSRGFALELGHIAVAADGIECNCGLKDCLEAYSSVTAVLKAAAQLNAHYRDKDLSEIILAAKHDPDLAAIISRAKHYLCKGLATACMLLDPDLIILGGGGMDSGLYDIAEISEELRSATALVNHHTQIRKATLGNQAGVMGAIYLAAQNLH